MSNTSVVTYHSKGGTQRLHLAHMPDDSVTLIFQQADTQLAEFTINHHDQKDMLRFLLGTTAVVPHDETSTLLDRLQELYLQATREHSHYYVGRVVQEAIVKIRGYERNDPRRSYDEAMASHLSHVRDLDVAMNGAGAAKHPLLIDIKQQLMGFINVVKALSLFNGWRRWQHNKRGSTYTVLTHKAGLQVGYQFLEPEQRTMLEEDEWTVYIGEKGNWCVCPTDEFKDGRFVLLLEG